MVQRTQVKQGSSEYTGYKSDTHLPLATLVTPDMLHSLHGVNTTLLNTLDTLHTLFRVSTLQQFCLHWDHSDSSLSFKYKSCKNRCLGLSASVIGDAIGGLLRLPSWSNPASGRLHWLMSTVWVVVLGQEEDSTAWVVTGDDQHSNLIASKI